ncbi:MAG: alcohol dehydrogenase catalytic domain-containing protein, partial [Novosphingobium sp.]|nr:alcohol dehydrogenase catalytic domain-containing protein [Novosphingobium sp.]
MKAAVFRELGRFEIEDVTLDKPRADEVRVRVLASGLCHSDYHMLIGEFPIPRPSIAGHEAAGVVEAVGSDVTEFQPGDRVISCASAYCGHCHECQTGYNYRCDDKPDRAGW